eukprot:gene280-1609_t
MGTISSCGPNPTINLVVRRLRALQITPGFRYWSRGTCDEQYAAHVNPISSAILGPRVSISAASSLRKGEEGVQSYSQILFAVADHASLLASGLHVAKESSDALKSAYHQVSEALSGLGDPILLDAIVAGLVLPKLMISTFSTTIRQVSEALSGVSEALSGVGEPILLGTVAAGLLLPGDCSIDVLVHKSGYTLQQHADMVKETKTALSAAGFEHVKTETNFCCQKDGIQVVVRFGDEQRFEPAAFQNAYADDPERDLVLASLLPYRTRFFQSQPPSAKHFLRIVRYWAEVMHAKDWEGHPDSVPSAFLLELLALDAFQSIPGDLDMEERMDAAMNKFLKNTSYLIGSTLIFSQASSLSHMPAHHLTCQHILYVGDLNMEERMDAAMNKFLIFSTASSTASSSSHSQLIM